MNILILNDNPPPLGGAEYHIELLKSLYEKKGHKVTLFFFNDYVKGKSKKNACIELNKLLSSQKFDLAHVHAVEYYFSDCIKLLTDEYNIQTIQTLHDYRYICPTGDCFRNCEICRECHNGAFWKAGVNGCYNLIGSFKRFFNESILKKDILGIKNIFRFISPSKFLKDIFEKSCFTGKIEHIYNFLDLEKYDRCDYPRDEENPYICFTGRLMPNKGVLTLVEAVKGTKIKLRIAGKGPVADIVAKKIAEDESYKNISLEGFLTTEDLMKLVRGASLAVVPSEWWEVLGFSAIEALALERPVIASKIGGLEEVVADDRGALFEPKNVVELREKIVNLMKSPQKLDELGKNGKKFVWENMSENIYYDKIMNVIGRV